MIAGRSITIALGLAALALGGCATPDPLEGERTVFNNPYGVPAIDWTGIGPQCDVELGRDATCLGAPLAYAGGRHVLLANGATERLTRQQRRILRERAELLEVLRDQPAPPLPPAPLPPAPPPPAPPPPIAEGADETP
jgi:hypothetical protein